MISFVEEPTQDVAGTIRVLLADDFRMVRSGIRALLETVPNVEVVAEAANGHEVLSLIPQHQPDVVLMDISMPRLNGLEATARITKAFPNIRVIILSMHASEEYVWRAQSCGASGYILKNSSPDELAKAIDAVTHGSQFFNVSEGSSEEVTEKPRMVMLLDRLTFRQREVFQLIAEGHSTIEIAEILNISAKTVETHRAALMNRLEMHDIPSLVRYAIKVGVIALDR